ncbi:hypothetical protein K8I61_09950 [bacterium]|nr:hypothetical protein [bacterium]
MESYASTYRALHVVDSAAFSIKKQVETRLGHFSRDVRDALPEFVRLVEYFSSQRGFEVREIDACRSAVEIEIFDGIENHDIDLLTGFFGPPLKPAGVSLTFRLAEDPLIRMLGGAMAEQTVYARDLVSGSRLFAAIWPWRIRPGVMTMHFGIYAPAAPDAAMGDLRRFLHEIPGIAQVA